MLGAAEEKQDPAISAPLGAAERLCCDFTSSASISKAPLIRVCEAAIRCKGGRCPTPWKMGHRRQELGLGQERRAGGFIQHWDPSSSPGALVLLVATTPSCANPVGFLSSLTSHTLCGCC